MSRTQAAVSGDTPFQDGLIALLPGADIVSVTGTAAMTRIAAGEFSLRTSQNSQAYVFFGGCSSLVQRTGTQDDVQAFFGSSRAGGSQNQGVGNIFTLSTGSIVAGSNVTINVLSTVNFSAGQYVTLDTVASGVQEFTQVVSITSGTAMVVKTVVNSHTTPFPVFANLFTTPAGVSGRPPFTGSSQLTPVTTSRPKGIAIKQMAIVYAVNTTAITVPTAGLTAIQYGNNVAPTVTTLITNATNGLATAAQAQPYVIPIPVPVANQGFITTPNTGISVEFDFTSGAANNVDVLGFFLTIAFNYN